MTASPPSPRDEPHGLDRRRFGLSLLLSVAACGLVYVLCQGRGEFGDEGSYCLIGQGILRGGLPYRDFFNEKPPLQYFLTALTMALTHATLGGARVLPAINLGLTILIVLMASPARRLASAVGWTLVLAIASIAFLAFSDTAESSLAVLYALAALLVLRWGPMGRRPIATALAVGCLFGLACGFRQTAVIAAAVAVLTPQMRPHWRFVLIGFVAGVLSWAGALMALGIGPDFLASTVLFHLSNPLAGKYLRGLNPMDIPAVLLWVTGFCGAGVVLWRRREGFWALAWIVAMAAPFFGRMDPFRLWPAMAVIILVLALHGADRGRWERLAPYGLAALAVAVVLVSHPHPMTRATREARLIVAHSAAGDAVWVAPFNPSLYCLADRRPASKYYFVLPWTRKADVLAQVGRDLVQNRPQLIADVSDGLYSLQTIVPDAQGIIDRGYHLLAQEPGLKLYERNAGVAQPGP
jgi:MFS family permease